MKAEKAQKEGASRAIQTKPSRGKVYMEDNRPHTFGQFNLIESIQQKRNLGKGLSFDLTSKELPVQMAWDQQKAPHGPANFTNADATNAVQNADFAQSVYVNISGGGYGNTKQAYTMFQLGEALGNVTICVVGHTHKRLVGGAPVYDIAGNCFIPGWQNWQMATPQNQANVISGLAVGGAFPGANRYPH